jgi:FkbM family methyltransferase
MARFVLNLNIHRRALPIVLDLDPALPNEATVLNDLRAGRLYEADVSEVICRTLAEGDCAIDVGANIGYFTTVLASLVGPRGRVLSLEPGAANLARLRANLAANNLANVVIVEQPASDVAEEIAFYINSDNAAGNAIWDPAEFTGNEKSKAKAQIRRMQATTLDAEVARLGLPRPKLIKIDTEGAEYKVLTGAQRLLAGAGVPYVIAELHEFGLNKLGSTQIELRRFMETLGYSTFALYYDGQLPKLIPPGVQLTTPFILNLLFSTPAFVAAAWRFDNHHPGASPPQSRPSSA